MTDTLTASALWADIEAVRTQAPLVHNITNLVVMNFTANALLAAGASPVMAHAHEEVVDMTRLAQALVLNIGTLEPYWVQSMQLALQTATQRGIATVLDPVGAGATPYRDHSIAALLATATPTVLRGNGSEIMSVAGHAAQTKGVDSSVASGDAATSARDMAQRTGAVVCVSGATDHVFDPSRWARLHNGHPWMTRITGAGCASSALIGAVCAVQPDAWRATVAAMAWISVAGEIAASTAIAQQQGVGSMQMLLIDQLQRLDASRFAAHLRLEAGR